MHAVIAVATIAVLASGVGVAASRTSKQRTVPAATEPEKPRIEQPAMPYVLNGKYYFGELTAEDRQMMMDRMESAYDQPGVNFEVSARSIMNEDTQIGVIFAMKVGEAVAKSDGLREQMIARMIQSAKAQPQRITIAGVPVVKSQWYDHVVHLWSFRDYILLVLATDTVATDVFMGRYMKALIATPEPPPVAA